VTRFRLHQDVAVVECGPFNGKVRAHGETFYACVTDASLCSVRVRFGDGDEWTFLLDSSDRAWNDGGRWRLVPLCHYCESPILGEPVTDEGPAHREWCSDECHDESAEADWEMRHPSGVAT
jgi:hypothetical protein